MTRTRRWFAAALVAAAFGSGVLAAAQTPPAGQRPSLVPPEVMAKLPPPVGEEHRVQADDIDKMLADGRVIFLDVREPSELEELGTIEGYVHIPIGQLEERLGELPKDKAILTA